MDLDVVFFSTISGLVLFIHVLVLCPVHQMSQADGSYNWHPLMDQCRSSFWLFIRRFGSFHRQHIGATVAGSNSLLPARGKTEGLAARWIIPRVGRRTFSSTIEDVVAACAVCQTALESCGATKRFADIGSAGGDPNIRTHRSSSKPLTVCYRKKPE